MLKQCQHPAKGRAYRLVAYQGLFAVIIASILLLVDFRAAYSALLAGVICLAANAYYIKRYFATTGAQNIKRIVRNMYWAEVSKFLITMVLFVVTLKLFNLSGLAFIGTFALLQMSNLVTPLVFSKPVSKVQAS